MLALTLACRCVAVTILTGPSVTPTTNAPLAATLQLTTDLDSRVSVLVTDASNVWERDFFDFGTNHTLPLLGFKPGQTNEILVTVSGRDRSSATTEQPLEFVTPPLPADFPKISVLKSEPALMEAGYTLFVAVVLDELKDYIIILDPDGNVVWYSPVQFNDFEVRQLPNGDLFLPDALNRFIEVNMLGNIVNTWTPPAAYPINPHDGVPTDHGTILYLSDVNRTVNNFPSNVTDPNAPLVTVTADDNPVVEMSATNGALLNTWSPQDMLDPTRISYLAYDYGYAVADNEHANAVIEDPSDQSIIVSLRNQNAVFKFFRSTGRLKWILGPPANWSSAFQPYLLTPVGTPFAWNYGQHAPSLTPDGTLLLYDDGNYRASPYDSSVADQDNHSRAVEFRINETNLQVAEVWDSSWQTNQDRLFTPAVGMTQWLPQTRDVLATYGYVTYVNGVHPSAYSPNATMARIIEYTHDPIPQKVFDVSVFDAANTNSSYSGYLVYRARRIPDLYPHPAAPVADLVVTNQTTMPHLEFSADPARSYVVQASTDLTTWTTLGAPVEGEEAGTFDYFDLNASQFSARYYRVVTQ
jgi:hypothetical protein